MRTSSGGGGSMTPLPWRPDSPPAPGGPHGTVFLDRDGVINRDSSDYVKSWAEFTFLPGALDGLALLAENGFSVIVVTNQSGVGRGLIAPEALETMNRNLTEQARTAGGRITDILFCPHGPEAGCDCRKPLPGLLLKARDRHRIDLSRSWMVGDSERDLQCGANAGCGGRVLVLTGNGAAARDRLAGTAAAPSFIAEDLYAAAARIVQNGSPGGPRQTE